MQEAKISRRGRAVAEGVGVARPRRAIALRLGLALAGLAGFVIVTIVLTLASRHVFGGNSDDATLVLEGQSMLSGHLFLQGWSMSYDSFWTVDVPWYAVADGVLGVGSGVFNVVPAVIAAVVVVAGVWISQDGRRDAGALIGAGVLIALLALPGPDLAYFLLQAGWHAATALWCLIVFAGVRKASSPWGFVLATVFLAAGLLGDLLTLPLAVAPVLVAGLVAARRQGSWRASRLHIAIVVAGACVAICVRLVAALVGTFSIESRSILASPQQLLLNIEALPNRIGGVFGVISIVGGLSSSPVVFRVAHGLLLALVLWAVALALASIVRAIFSRSAPDNRVGSDSSTGSTGSTGPAWVLDDLLVLACLSDLAMFALVSTDGSVSLARYLVPGVIDAAVLASRAVTRFVRGHPGSATRLLAVLGVVVLVLCAVDFGVDALGPPAPQQARQLSAFLTRKGLRSGIGDYWSSSIVTVDSGGKVAVRPVSTNREGMLVRYRKQSTAAWYSGQSFQFLVYDSTSIWHDVDSTTAVKTFGEPARTYAVGTYRVLVWSHPLAVAP